jgi:hypothetical protein
MEQDILTEDHHIIDKFRDMVAKRYEFSSLSERFDLPPVITSDVIDDVKSYFLGTIYPDAAERRRLEMAFANMASYMKQPKKIWGLFGNMAGALFKFGRHFMQALKAGFASLDSFVGAKKFEASMAVIANRNGIRPPMTDEEFEDCLYQLERKEVQQFIDDVKSLFGAMVNTPLLLKTIHILDDAILTMQSKPHIYPEEDINGLKLGRNLLNQGYELFSKYDESTKQLMVDIIYKNELWFMDYVYQKREN